MTRAKEPRVSGRVLHRLYQQPICLNDAITALAQGEISLRDRVVHPAVAGVVWQRFEEFLQKTIVCFRNQLPSVQQPWRLSQRLTQQQVVLQAIDLLVAAGADNVLRAGYRKRSAGHSSTFVAGLFHAQPWHPSSTTAALLSPDWCQLLSKVGYEVMLALLLHGSIFMPLPHGNYLQLAGTPVHLVARDKANLPMPQMPATDWLLTAYKQQLQQLNSSSSGLARGTGHSRLQGKQRAAGVPGTPQTVSQTAIGPPPPQQQQQQQQQQCKQHATAALQTSSSAAQHQRHLDVAAAAAAAVTTGKGAAAAGCGDAVIRPRKQCRPPAWLRKKLKLQQQQEQQHENAQQQQGLAGCSWASCLHQAEPTLSPSAAAAAGRGGNSGGGLVCCDHVLLADLDSCDEPATQVMPTSPVALWDFEEIDSGSSSQQLQQQQQCFDCFHASDVCEMVTNPSPPGTQPQQQQQQQQQDDVDQFKHIQAQDTSPPADQQQQQADISLQAASTGPAAAAASANKVPNPGSWSIPRNLICHCTTFSRKPGLPAAHILRQLQGKPAAAKRLYQTIFVSPSPPQGPANSAAAAAGTSSMRSAPAAAQQNRPFCASAGKSFQQRPVGGVNSNSGPNAAAAADAASIRIRPGHKVLVSLLQRMIVRANRCPYGLLLHHHCPLLTTSRAAGTAAVGSSLSPKSQKSPAQESAQPVQPQQQQQGVNRGIDAVAPAHCVTTKLAATTAAADAPIPMEVDTGTCQHIQQQQQHSQPAAAGSCSGQTSLGRHHQQQQQPASSQLCLAAQVVPHAAVERYVWSVVRRVVPPALLGSRHNRCVLRAAVRCVIRLRRHETVRLDILIKGLKTSHMPWLSSSTSSSVPVSLHLCHQRLVSCWCWWLITGLVLPLLRNSFYVTESEPYRQAVFYYRKPVWHQLSLQGLQELKATCFKPVPAARAAAILQERALGVARLRLLPKRNGMRPIAKLGSAALVKFRARPTAAAATAAKRAAHEDRGKPVVLQNGAVCRASAGITAAGGGPDSSVHAKGAGHDKQQIQQHRQGEQRQQRKQRAARATAASATGRRAHRRARQMRGLSLATDTGRRVGAKWPAAAAAGGGGGANRRGGVVLSFKAVNTVLQPAFQALRAEVDAQPNVLACSVFGLDDICKVLYPFIRRFRAAQAMDPQLKPYIISADIRKAFDSVDISKLLSLVSPLIQHPEYQMMLYTTTSPQLGAVRVRYRTEALLPVAPRAALGPSTASSNRPKGMAADSGTSKYTDFPSWVKSWVRSARSTNTVFMDQVPYRTVSSSQVHQLLQQHLTANLLRVGGTWLQQAVGIAQGSIASTLLCSIYLADLERQHLMPLLPGLNSASNTARPDRQHPQGLAAARPPSAAGAIGQGSVGTSAHQVSSSPCGISALAACAANSSSSPSVAAAATAGVLQQQQQQQQQQQVSYLCSPINSDAGHHLSLMATPVAAAARTPYTAAAAGAAAVGGGGIGGLLSPGVPGSFDVESHQECKSGSGHGSHGRLTQSGGKLSSQSGGKSNKSTQPSTDDPERLPTLRRRHNSAVAAAAAAGVSKLVLPPPSAPAAACSQSTAAAAAREQMLQNFLSQQQRLADLGDRQQLHPSYHSQQQQPPPAAGQDDTQATEPDVIMSPVAEDSPSAAAAAVTPEAPGVRIKAGSNNVTVSIDDLTVEHVTAELMTADKVAGSIKPADVIPAVTAGAGAAVTPGSSPAGSTPPELILDLTGGSTPSKKSPAALPAPAATPPPPAAAAADEIYASLPSKQQQLQCVLRLDSSDSAGGAWGTGAAATPVAALAASSPVDTDALVAGQNSDASEPLVPTQPAVDCNPMDLDSHFQQLQHQQESPHPAAAAAAAAAVDDDSSSLPTTECLDDVLPGGTREYAGQQQGAQQQWSGSAPEGDALTATQEIPMHDATTAGQQQHQEEQEEEGRQSFQHMTMLAAASAAAACVNRQPQQVPGLHQQQMTAGCTTLTPCNTALQLANAAVPASVAQSTAAIDHPCEGSPSGQQQEVQQQEVELLEGQLQWPAAPSLQQQQQQPSSLHQASQQQRLLKQTQQQLSGQQQVTGLQPPAADGGRFSGTTAAAAAAPAGVSRAARRRPDSVLLRLVDDSLAITTSRAAAEAFILRLMQGFPEHNCSINPDKTQLNFTLTTPDGRQLQPNVWRSKDGSCWVRWCGLLINVVNLELMADYTRYSGQHIATSLTLSSTERPGCMLLNKVLSYMRPKMHALLLDSTINSPLTIRLNIYQAFLLSFMKFHWAVRCLLRDRRAHRDPRLLLKAIQGCINYTVGLVRGRVHMARKRLQLDVRCSVSRCHIRWLGLTAARKVLGRKQSAYRKVLAAVDQQLADSTYRHVRMHLAPVTEHRRSAVFEEVLY